MSPQQHQYHQDKKQGHIHEFLTPETCSYRTGYCMMTHQDKIRGHSPNPSSKTFICRTWC